MIIFYGQNPVYILRVGLNSTENNRLGLLLLCLQGLHQLRDNHGEAGFVEGGDRVLGKPKLFNSWPKALGILFCGQAGEGHDLGGLQHPAAVGHHLVEVGDRWSVGNARARREGTTLASQTNVANLTTTGTEASNTGSNLSPFCVHK